MKSASFKYLTICLIVLFVTGCATTDEQPISIEVSEGTQLRFDISPNGSELVFDIWGQLWTLPATGGTPSALTDAVSDTANDTDPIYSPDGSIIVFCSDRPEGIGLYTLNLADANISKITDGNDTEPAFSSNGKKLAFVRNGKIGVYDFVDKTEIFLTIDSTPSPYLNSPFWMPNEESIMFVSDKTFWTVSNEGGIATPVVEDSLVRFSPSVSPAGDKLAYFASDSTEKKQVFVANTDGSNQIQLTNHTDVFHSRLRWSIDGNSLIYSADGKFWKVSIDSSEPEQIPFSVNLSFQRKTYKQKQVTFSNAGETLYARGHMGLRISPDGAQFAMIALGKLWVAPIGGRPQEICSLPFPVAGLSWHPDGTQIAWSAGVGGSENIYSTNIKTGETKQLTDLPGREVQPSWSPDGNKLAFFYWEKPVLTTDPWLYDDAMSFLLVADANALPVTTVETTNNLVPLSVAITWRFLGGQEILQWSSDSRHLLVEKDGPTLVPLEGDPRPIDSLPPPAPWVTTYVNWNSDGYLYYIFNDQAWKVPWDSVAGVTGEPERLSDAAAQYLSVSDDGTILFLSSDGLHVIGPDGAEQLLGWPLQFTTPDAEQPLLIRNVRILDGTTHMTPTAGDILIEDGMITRIASANSIEPGDVINVIEAEGRTVIPGLINLHEHIWDELNVPAHLYYGITTFKDMGSPLAMTAGLRDAIAAGVLPGPRIVFGGFQFWGDGGQTSETGHMPDGPDGIKRAASLLAGQGADHLKMRMFSNIPHMVNLIREAHNYGWSTSGHISTPLPLVAAGINGMEHLSVSGGRTNKILYDDMVQLFRAADMWVVPSVVGYSSTVRVAEDPSCLDWSTESPFVSPFMRWWVLRLPPQYVKSYDRFAREARESMIKLYRAGVKIGAGADAPQTPWAMHWELEEMVTAGMTPAEALSAATSMAASILGAEKEIGSIVVGKRADLVILDADPLEDISNTREIWGVVRDGRLIDRESLLALGVHWQD